MLYTIEELPPIDFEPPLKKLKNTKVSDSKFKKSHKKKKKNNRLSKNNDEPKIVDDSSNDKSSAEVTEFNSAAWSSLGVPAPILKALEDNKFTTPTVIQSLTLGPAILGHRDILGAAETGSGKTLAFGIPILAGILKLKEEKPEVEDDEQESDSTKEINRCGTADSWLVSTEGNNSAAEFSGSEQESEEELDDDLVNTDGIGCVKVIDYGLVDDCTTASTSVVTKPLYALILTPTRELAIQIRDHLCKAAKYTDIKIAVVIGGMAAVKQERILSKGPEIVIATPGRLWELIDQGNIHLSQLHSIKYLAIDETDRMLEKGHFQELHQILERINSISESLDKRQTFVFSATLTLVHDIPDFLMRKKKQRPSSKIFKITPGQKLQKVIDLLKIKNPKVVDITKERGTAGTLTECRIACTVDHKDYYLYYFLKRHPGRTLVFCNSIGCVKRLATLFGILNCNPLPLHANMIQKQRLKNLERFQKNSDGLLIATDVAARGLDIPNVEHVIHYQVPRTSESYVHRSGRTARAQKEGITVLMMEPSEKHYYTKLCKTLGHTQDIPTFPVIDRLLVAVKERVNVAREIDKLELRCKRDNLKKSWLKKAAEEMDLLLDEDEQESTMELKESADMRRHLKIKRNQLSNLLLKPLFSKSFSGKYPEMNIGSPYILNSEKAVDTMKNVTNNKLKLNPKSEKNNKKRRRE
ncbi:ATP-dependent RNA helicase DDX24 [Microplitis demolitor]|uniref:ATP-dependent RNA helicase DDX24 n=1 Tax=Microplitis demolitor TaxID=69319 RepID=UPI0004CD1126|nr:ATP-dependent RNA helicase DDX24 [Microplitis demolitor]